MGPVFGFAFGLSSFVGAASGAKLALRDSLERDERVFTETLDSAKQQSVAALVFSVVSCVLEGSAWNAASPMAGSMLAAISNVTWCAFGLTTGLAIGSLVFGVGSLWHAAVSSRA